MTSEDRKHNLDFKSGFHITKLTGAKLHGTSKDVHVYARSQELQDLIFGSCLGKHYAHPNLVTWPGPQQ